MHGETLTIGEYAKLRASSRTALGRVGINSNPGSTDHYILSGLSDHLGQPAQESYDEWAESSGACFRDMLATVLDIELPTTVEAVTSALDRLG
ncbi:MAG: hypothetical protein Q7T41_01185 [Candidatus Saccharibacteria bacterium]|nr:hypothetical protein [Candidatus Saccharibacteria bacterium]